ncbi:MAG: hypothetical protein FWD16_02315 [Clostridia bacterium]|nr:hypothetical protein [Clostridia bacterium]
MPQTKNILARKRAAAILVVVVLALATAPLGLPAALSGEEAAGGKAVYLPEMIADPGQPTSVFMPAELHVVPTEGFNSRTHFTAAVIQKMCDNPALFLFPDPDDVTALVAVRCRRTDNDKENPGWISSWYQMQFAEWVDREQLVSKIFFVDYPDIAPGLYPHLGPDWEETLDPDKDLVYKNMAINNNFSIESDQWIYLPPFGTSMTNQPVHKAVNTTYSGIFFIFAYYGELPQTATETPAETPTEAPTLAKTAESTTSPTYEPTTTTTPTSPVFKLGDLNCNGNVDIDDILLARDFVFGKTPTAPQLAQLKRLNPAGNANIDIILKIRDIIFGG